MIAGTDPRLPLSVEAAGARTDFGEAGFWFDEHGALTGGVLGIGSIVATAAARSLAGPRVCQ